jgi:hypothetical protein
MKRVVINTFARGQADERYDDTPGAFAHSKQFDILTHPRRLVPLRGMESDTANTGIGNIIVGYDGLMLGVGVDTGGTPANGSLWQRSGYGASDDWARPGTDQLSGAAVNYELLVQNPDAGTVRTVYWSSANLLVASDPLGGSSASTQALTFVSIGQGLVHPKDHIIYIPYRTSSAQQIATIAPNGSAFGGYTSTSFTGLQFLYRAYCLSWYGDYLAIPQTSMQGIGVNGSIVGLWRRDTSITTFDEIIPWGAGNLKVLNNLDGTLIGISTKSANNAESFSDYDSIMIKAWNGGAEPTLIKELKVPYTGEGSYSVARPTASINPRVNFVYQNRLYFSVNLVPADGINPARYGLWSVGRNKITGEWTVVQEHVATNDNSDTGVIAAAITGDFLVTAHTAEGTLTNTNQGIQTDGAFNATSVWESLVNHGMSDEDRLKKKKIFNVSVRTQPLLTGGQIVLKHRCDSNGADADWTTIYTYNTAADVGFDTGAVTMKDGYDHQFRIESTGGAIVTAIGYRYDELQSNV